MVKAIRLALVGFGDGVEVEAVSPTVVFTICVVTRGPTAPCFEMTWVTRVSVPSARPETSMPEIDWGSLSTRSEPVTGVPPLELVIS